MLAAFWSDRTISVETGMYLVGPWVVPLEQRDVGNPPWPGEVVKDRVARTQIIFPMLIGPDRNLALERGHRVDLAGIGDRGRNACPAFLSRLVEDPSLNLDRMPRPVCDA